MGVLPETVILKKLDRKGQLFYLSFSNGEQLRATPAAVSERGLVVGMAFSPVEFEQLKELIERRLAYYTAESILARRPYSIGRFKEKLREKSISSELISEIVKEFKSRDLLDDYRYSIARVQSLLNRKPAGRAFLAADLQRRLIPRPIAEKAVAEALSGLNEIEIALRLLQKRQASLAKFDLETARRKAYNYLSRRSISYGASKEAFDRLFCRGGRT